LELKIARICLSKIARISLNYCWYDWYNQVFFHYQSII